MNQPVRRISVSSILGGAVVLLLLAGLAVVLRYADTPPTFLSPLATKQALKQTAEARPTPEQTPRFKPTPVGVDQATPEATAFSPLPHSTPAGAGYIVQIYPPVSGYEYHARNTWYEDTNGANKRTLVYAGSLATSDGTGTQQGAVLVITAQLTSVNNDTVSHVNWDGVYLTPCISGPVRVVAAVGERIKLRSTNGTIFYFDVPTRSYVNSPACTPTPTLTPSPTIISPLSTPTYTPTPRNDRTFTGDATTSGLGPSNPISGATVTLYRLTLFDWQIAESVTTDANGQFALHDAGLSESSWYLILIEYPTGYTPTLAQPGLGFLAVGNQILLSLEPLAPGVYSDNHFISLWDPNATPLPGTPTPPPLPTVPWPTPTP